MHDLEKHSVLNCSQTGRMGEWDGACLYNLYNLDTIRILEQSPKHRVLLLLWALILQSCVNNDVLLRFR